MKVENPARQAAVSEGSSVGVRAPAYPARTTGTRHRLRQALGAGRHGLICYLPLGDPCLPPSLASLYVDEGVDVLELGFPFDHPHRDGRTVASSMHRARAAGAGLAVAFGDTRKLRDRYPDQAMAWMVYPGAVPPECLPELAAGADVDGVLYPAPAHRFRRIRQGLSERNIEFLQFLKWNSGERDVAATRDAGGYVMVQARPGTTGVRNAPLPDTAAVIQRVKATGTHAAVALGIGISNAEQVREALLMGADAVIVGSAVVEASLRGPKELRTLLRSLRRTLDGG